MVQVDSGGGGGAAGAEARDQLPVDVERQALYVAVVAGVSAVVAADDVAAARQEVQHRQVDKAADAQRGVGARDQERAWEAAAGHRHADLRPAGRRRRGATRGDVGALRQLIDAALQQFLIGTQIRQLVGARRRKTRQQRK